MEQRVLLVLWQGSELRFTDIQLIHDQTRPGTPWKVVVEHGKLDMEARADIRSQTRHSVQRQVALRSVQSHRDTALRSGYVEVPISAVDEATLRETGRAVSKSFRVIPSGDVLCAFGVYGPDALEVAQRAVDEWRVATSNRTPQSQLRRLESHARSALLLQAQEDDIEAALQALRDAMSTTTSTTVTTTTETTTTAAPAPDYDEFFTQMFRASRFALVTLEGPESVELAQIITQHGGTVEEVVTTRTSFVVTSPEAVKARQDPEITKGLNYGAPLVSAAFVRNCSQAGAIIDVNPYLLAREQRSVVARQTPTQGSSVVAQVSANAPPIAARAGPQLYMRMGEFRIPNDPRSGYGPRSSIPIQDVLKVMANYSLIIPCVTTIRKVPKNKPQFRHLRYFGVFDYDIWTGNVLELIKSGEQKLFTDRPSEGYATTSEVKHAFLNRVMQLRTASAVAAVCPLFRSLYEAVRHMVSVFRANGLSCLCYFTGGKGFRVLVRDPELWLGVYWSGGYSSTLINEFFPQYFSQMPTPLDQSKIDAFLDDAIYGTDKATKPDLLAHPDTGVYCVDFDDIDQTEEPRDREIIRRDQADADLVTKILDFWGWVINSIPELDERPMLINPSVNIKGATPPPAPSQLSPEDQATVVERILALPQVERLRCIDEIGVALSSPLPADITDEALLAAVESLDPTAAHRVFRSVRKATKAVARRAGQDAKVEESSNSDSSELTEEDEERRPPVLPPPGPTTAAGTGVQTDPFELRAAAQAQTEVDVGALDALRGELLGYLTQLENVERSIMAQRRALASERQELDERLASIRSNTVPEHLVLNVGGHEYEAERDVLVAKSDSVFASWFSGLEPLNRDDQGRIFIDRDGEMFGYILAWITTGEVELPNEEYKERLVAEAELYKLPELAEYVQGRATCATGTQAQTDEELLPRVPGLKAQCDELLQRVQRELAQRLDVCLVAESEVASDSRQVTEAREKLEGDARAIARLNEGAEGRVTLTVGGVPFETTRSTLARAADSALAAVVASTDGDELFIDADPAVFQYTLNYLRDPSTAVLPRDAAMHQRLAAQARELRVGQLERALDPRYRAECLSAANITMQQDERDLRNLYSADPTAAAVQQPHALLCNVFEEIESFVACHEEPEIERVLEDMHNPQVTVIPRVGERSVVEHLGSFRSMFNYFSNRIFDGFDWSNVFVAGGAVLACLLPSPERMFESTRKAYLFPTNTEQRRNASPFHGSDIDLFICGLDEQAADRKVAAILTFLASKMPRSMVVSTTDAVTFVADWPVRRIQIITRLYRTPVEVLMSFDVDCACVGYDGADVWCLPRARRAINGRVNIVDPIMQSKAYDYRLFKYSLRGFAVAVPGFVRRTLPDHVLSRIPSQVQGLAKLLCLEHSEHVRRQIQCTCRYGAKDCKAHSNPMLKSVMINTKHDRLLYDLVGGTHSEYDGGFIPYGPFWTIERLGNAEGFQTRPGQTRVDVDNNQRVGPQVERLFSAGTDGARPYRWRRGDDQESIHFHPVEPEEEKEYFYDAYRISATDGDAAGASASPAASPKK